MNALRVQVEGIGLWSPSLTDFDAFRRLLAGEALSQPVTRPNASALSLNERRRAPEGILVAIEAASQAVTMSGRDADSLACVFASAYGDQATTDYMCHVLARVPTELSPTRFHNSVHNASAGYWTIANDCRAPSSAICAGYASFGAGLLEAAVQACADNRAVLLALARWVNSLVVGLRSVLRWWCRHAAMKARRRLALHLSRKIPSTPHCPMCAWHGCATILLPHACHCWPCWRMAVANAYWQHPNS
jgi:hypothetical protein